MKNTVALALRITAHLAALLPLAWLLWAVPAGELGGDPVEELIHFLGLGALRLILLCLLVSPLTQLLTFNPLIKLRRPLGLWCYVWASLHFGAWLAFDLGFEWGLIGEEIIKRNYIFIGVISWLVLTALAISSVPKLIRLMGRRWKMLHQWIYLIAILVCIHFWWSLKSGWIEPMIYLSITLCIVGLRKKKLLRLLPFK